MTHRTHRRSSLAPSLGLGALFASLLLLNACEGEEATSSNCTSTERIVTMEVLVPASTYGMPRQGGQISIEDCRTFCEDDLYDDLVGCGDVGWVDANGQSVDDPGNRDNLSRRVQCRWSDEDECEGRRHVAVTHNRNGEGPTEVAAWLARATLAEAGSVPAFLALAEELAAHGAPDALVRGARRAAEDEVTHAHRMRRLARRAGAKVDETIPEVTTPSRSLFDLARENAVEGCVCETFAGLMAMHQAHHAPDPLIRATMAPIAGDEVRHGELAWQIHRWACTQLEPNDVAELETAIRDAADALIAAKEEQDAREATTRRALGLPPRTRAAQLARALRQHLWS